ncbi:MAG: M20 family metallopeptidase [Chloroflexota bacterium]
MSIETSILEYIGGRQDEMTSMLQGFVERESGTYDKSDVDQLGAHLRERLSDLDFETSLLRQEKYGDHVIGRRDLPGKRLLLVGHFDTVFGSGTLRERPWRVEDGRCFGPGVYDMKGGLVIMLTALAALREARSPAWESTGLSVFLNSDEEVLSPTSSGPIDEIARQSQAVCILEPARPGGEYTFVRKGAGKFYMKVTGRAAHAGGQPERGRSATLELAHKIVALHAMTNFETGTTVNVGVIRGGERSNIICPEAYAEIDLRALDLEEMEGAIESMRQIAARSFVPDTTTEFWGDPHFPPLMRGEGNAALFEIVRKAADTVGFQAREIVSGGGSDGNHTGQFCPTIDGMGIRGDGAHTEHEFAVLDSLPERAQVLALFLHRWATATG